MCITQISAPSAVMLATATLLLIGACLIALDKIGAVKMIIGGVIQ